MQSINPQTPHAILRKGESSPMLQGFSTTGIPRDLGIDEMAGFDGRASGADVINFGSSMKQWDLIAFALLAI